jgi:hypothetical protein
MRLLKISTAFRLLALVLIVFTSCDTLHEDAVTDSQPTFDSKIYVLPDASTTFDLQSRVKSVQPVTITISSRPSNGELLEENGLYHYSPRTSGGTDSFQISITDSRGAASQRTLELVRVQRGQSVCGAIARDDNSYGLSSNTVDIDVLQNDYTNGCDGQIELTIYRPESNYPPYKGTAEVVNGKIRYTKGSDFPGYDKFFYQLVHISAAGERSAASYGRVYVSTDAPCTLDLNDDSKQFDLSTIGNVVKFNITDVICKPNNNYLFQINRQPSRGKVEGGPDVGFTYELPSSVSEGFIDSFSYSVCVDGTCDEATITLTFSGNVPSCRVSAGEDNYSIVGSSQTEFQFQIFNNDNFCGESISSASVVGFIIALPQGAQLTNPQYMSQFIRIENGALYYKPAAAPVYDVEQIIYEVVTSTGKTAKATAKIRRR